MNLVQEPDKKPLPWRKNQLLQVCSEPAAASSSSAMLVATLMHAAYTYTAYTQRIRPGQ